MVAAAALSALLVPPATNSACSRLASPSSLHGFRFDPPGSTTPAISCSRAIATLRCPPSFENLPCKVLTGLPMTAELVRISAVAPLRAETEHDGALRRRDSKATAGQVPGSAADTARSFHPNSLGCFMSGGSARQLASHRD
jgi:hypothetical protein